MKLNIRKTDKRFTGYQQLGYVISLTSTYNPMMSAASRKINNITDFHMIRQWCIDTWGMSCEREHWLALKEADASSINTHWCWHSEFYETKIYLVSDKEANWFKLKWL